MFYELTVREKVAYFLPKACIDVARDLYINNLEIWSYKSCKKMDIAKWQWGCWWLSSKLQIVRRSYFPDVAASQVVIVAIFVVLVANFFRSKWRVEMRWHRSGWSHQIYWGRLNVRSALGSARGSVPPHRHSALYRPELTNVWNPQNRSVNQPSSFPEH